MKNKESVGEARKMKQLHLHVSEEEEATDVDEWKRN